MMQSKWLLQHNTVLFQICHSFLKPPHRFSLWDVWGKNHLNGSSSLLKPLFSFFTRFTIFPPLASKNSQLLPTLDHATMLRTDQGIGKGDWDDSLGCTHTSWLVGTKSLRAVFIKRKYSDLLSLQFLKLVPIACAGICAYSYCYLIKDFYFRS